MFTINLLIIRASREVVEMVKRVRMPVLLHLAQVRVVPTVSSNGSVSFMIYNAGGLSESGGTPYRVSLNKKELVKLTPIPVT